jgi:pimeloyl-ACP methyl ester carboxylesterase
MNQPTAFVDLAQPPEVRSPLGPLGGAEPQAPGWFRDALACAPERGRVETPRGGLELLTWGERGKPGLLFVHGNRAHADWWSFIAPFFARDYRVAALSQAGMGGSDWRERYDFAGYADDFEAVIAAAGLDAGPRAPVLVGHSLGGRLVLEFAAGRPDRLFAAICIDIGFAGVTNAMRAQREQKMAATAGRSPEQRRRVYPTLAEALAHFRLPPPQPLANLYIVDYIARRALKPAPLPDGGEGWTWRFDLQIFERMDRDSIFHTQDGGRIAVPIAHIFGDESAFRAPPEERGPFPEHAVVFGIPDAHHHVPIDQPLALTATIRGLLAGWGA